MLINKTQIIVIGKNNRRGIKTILKLRCDECNLDFIRKFNIKIIENRPRHYCNSNCHSKSMKSGGRADISRKKTCREKYGSDYFITHPTIASKSGKKAHTPEIEKRRSKTRCANWEINSTKLSRGLIITRSKEEVEFFKTVLLHLILCENEIEYSKYINGWFVDGYIKKLDLWIQYDGTYWHSKPGAKVKDNKQDIWFETNKKNFVRINDQKWKSSRNQCLEVISSFTSIPTGSINIHVMKD
jgi:hypothetical protein